MDSRGRWLRCEHCTRLPHRPELCLGRDAGCCCTWCPGRAAAILADARRYRADPMVRELLILAAARVRRQQLADSYPQPARNVRCAGFEWDAERRKWVRCQEFAESGRFGRTLRYHSKPCQRRAKWLRHKARRDAVQGSVIKPPGRAISGEAARSRSADAAERRRSAAFIMFGLEDWATGETAVRAEVDGR